MTAPLRRSGILAALAIFLAAASCAVNPVTGKKELMLISESAEIELGKSTHEGLRREYGLYEDPRLTAYVDGVARRMVPHTHRNALEYHFAVLDTPVPNAFAAPGGYIYVTRGLLAMMNSEAELAAVVAHELGHVNARHSVRKMSQQMLMMGGVLLAGALNEDVGKAAPFMMAGLQVLFLKYSRDDEYEADRLGVLYSRSGGYSAAQMIPFFTSIRKLEAAAEASSGLKVPNFLSTHPLTARRIEEARALLDPGDMEMDVLRDEFLVRVDGIVFGDDPRQGYVDGSAFYHPVMKFAFDVPEGWAVQNTPKQVLVASRDEKAAVVMTAEQTDRDPGAYHKEKLQGFTDVDVQEVSAGGHRVNGLSGFRGLYHLSPKPAAAGETVDPKKVMTVDLDCIRKDGLIYTFLSVAAKPDFAGYDAAMARAVRSFRPLTDPARLNVRPRRLMVRKAGSARTLQAALTAWKVPPERWKTIAFLNALELEDRVEAARLIKITQ